MAESVVKSFEVVEVEEKNGNRLPLATGQLQFPVERFFQESPVKQARQRITNRLFTEGFAQLQASQGEIEIGLSVVSVAELVHGAYRAKTQAQQQGRLAFIERPCLDVPVHPVTLDIARLAGRIEGQQEAIGSVRVILIDGGYGGGG